MLVIAVLGSEEGLKRAAAEGGEDDRVEIFVGGCDKDVNGRGMITPGVGDIGDRLFLTIGK